MSKVSPGFAGPAPSQNVVTNSLPAHQGELDGVLVVIFATLGAEGLSIISARPVSKNGLSLLP